MTDYPPKLTILSNVDNIVTLRYDTPKEMPPGEYGVSWLCGVNKDGVDMTLWINTQSFYDKVAPFTAGDVVNIRKDEYESGKFGYNVIPQEGTSPRVHAMASPNNDPIHVLSDKPDWDKIAEGKVRHGFAIEAFKQDAPLNEEIAANIDKWVSYVMTGEVPDDLPF